MPASEVAAHYDSVNGSWGRDALPPINTVEASRAARKLMRHFAHRKSSWLRRCWLSSKPTTGHWRGWGRLVHDVSHRAYQYEYRSAVPNGGHSRTHAAIEKEMVLYVVSCGWLDGKLKPTVKSQTLADKVEARATHAANMLARAERRLKLAQTITKKWRRKVAYYQARAGACAA